ncbi:MAG: cytochrome c3 family protein [Planctomycetota bacterium]
MKLRTIIFFIAVMAMAGPLWAAHTDGGCAGCHAAHNSSSSAALEGITIPLWKGVLAPATGFTVYNTAFSSTIDATVGQPDGDSRMCLSCHDGTTQTGVGISGSTDLSQDLTDDHPISFVYDTALATPATGDDNLNDPSTTLIPGGGAGEFIETEWLDSNSKVQCTTCHNVHAVHTDMALRTDNTTGGLCKACHTQ